MRPTEVRFVKAPAAVGGEADSALSAGSGAAGARREQNEQRDEQAENGGSWLAHVPIEYDAGDVLTQVAPAERGEKQERKQ